MAVFSFMLQSCVHDELISSSDPASKEYHSKSLWKEDEIYIVNVKKIYEENEEKIRKEHGTPLWEYAMTMDKFDESYLLVPVRKNGEIAEVLEVPRFGKKIYFKYTNEEERLSFFRKLFIDTPKKTLPTSLSNEASKLICVTRTVSIWYPDSESNPNGSGHWGSSSYTTCYNLDIESFENPDDGSDGGGYDYPPFGGGGPDNPLDSMIIPQTPCEKGKNLFNATKANLKPLITGGMYSYINNSSTGEGGIYLKKDNNGNITTEVAPYVANAILPIKAGGIYYSAVHTHPNSTYPMFSWSDIYVLYTLEMNASIANGGQSSLILVCQDDNGVKQTYMIAFESIGTMMEDTFNNPENNGCSHEEIKNRMDTELEKLYRAEEKKSSPNYESVFLQMNFGTNIGLYKANNDLTGFSKLQINSNTPNAVVNSIDCN
jgi:hypothetical protein